ncbi:MAG: 30S ribosomal protein S16 [Elusimicrobiota bacterium]|jgi:small subunit ribosomal protein S16|nr:30S ribosomal protein S16 [Elusimicrobiota bacterium]
MAVRLRLQRKGKPKRPYYRVVAIDQRAKRDGEPIEILGQYDPIAVDNKLNVKIDRVNYWLNVGAKASNTVAELIKKAQKTTVESK